MIERKSWEEFRNAGLLWWINMILHTFGWAITVDLKDGKIIDCYPAGWRCIGEAGGKRWTGLRRPEVDLYPAQMKMRFEVTK